MLANAPVLTSAQKIRLAHDAVFKAHPIALAAVAARWQVIPDPRKKTFCTNGKTMRYNPEWVDSLTLGQVACVVLHEICHVALGHTFRLAKIIGPVNKRTGYTAKQRAAKERFNIAADLAINSRLMPEYLALCPRAELEDLITKGCFPRHGSYAEFPEHKAAEWYYAELLKDEPQGGNPDPQPGGSGDGEGDDGDMSVGAGLDDGDADDTDARIDMTVSEASDRLDELLDELTKDKGGDNEGKDNDGDAMRSDDADGEPGTGNAFGSIEPYDTDPEEIEEGEKEFQQTVTAAIVTDKSWGTSGGWFETQLQDLCFPTDPDQPKIDWRTKLREFLTKVCRQGYSYSRPSRRHGWRRDVILPAHRGKGNTNGVLIVDTSGSMGDAECNIAMRELESILMEFPRATVKVISCDTRVFEGDTYTRSDFPLREYEAWKGRGGTDLDPAFRWVADQPRNSFDWCIILTDMEWYYAGAPNPGVPTIWMDCRPYRGAMEGQLEVPFGTYVEVVV